MDITWKIKRSKVMLLIILIISALPILVAFILYQSIVQLALLFILCTMTLYFLHHQTLVFSIKGDNCLSCSNGRLIFSNRHFSIEGKQAKSSFTLGLVTLLVIESESKSRVKLWLIADNIKDCSAMRPTISYQSSGWRELQACYYLSQ